MKVIALALASIAIGQAVAGSGTATPDEYIARMASGQCWGTCAYKATMKECISCGLTLDGAEHKAAEAYYCHKLQPKCGHK
jgi:hypothetical protein